LLMTVAVRMGSVIGLPPLHGVLQLTHRALAED